MVRGANRFAKRGRNVPCQWISLSNRIRRTEDFGLADILGFHAGTQGGVAQAQLLGGPAGSVHPALAVAQGGDVVAAAVGPG